MGGWVGGWEDVPVCDVARRRGRFHPIDNRILHPHLHLVGLVYVQAHFSVCLFEWVGGWLSKLCIHWKVEENEAVLMRCGM